MILTGKALDDFLQFHNQPKVWYDLIIKSESYTILYALIIEWMDTVGYFIEITKDRYITEQWVNNVERFPLYKSRQEATKQAILKANQIYNELPR